MKYLVKNQAVSLKGNTKVFDEQNNLAFIVKGNFFSNAILKTYKKTIKDLNKKKLFVVRNKFWHAPYHPSAIIYNDKKQKLAVVKASHLIKNGYEVFGATEPINIEGTGWNLDIKLGDKVIGKIMPPDKISFNDSYCIDVFDADDTSFLIALMIAIDNIHDQTKRKK